MAIQPLQDRSNNSILDEFGIVGPDATAAFEPSTNPSDPTAHATSENLITAPRTPALDEEDEVEDDDPDEDDDLVADDDLEEDEDEDDDLDDEDDDLEDDDDDLDDEDDDEDDEDDEDEDDEDEEDKPRKVK